MQNTSVSKPSDSKSEALIIKERMEKETQIDEYTTRRESDGRTVTRRVFGDWLYFSADNPMDAYKPVRICSGSSLPQSTSHRRLCFRITTPHHAHAYLMGFTGKDYWPYCDLDGISAKIDDGRLTGMPSGEKRGGSCASGFDIDGYKGKIIEEMSTGKEMKIKSNGQLADINLNGFAEAFEFAIEQRIVIQAETMGMTVEELEELVEYRRAEKQRKKY